MAIETISEARFLLAGDAWISCEDLMQASGLGWETLEILVDFGVIEPRGHSPGEWRFEARAIQAALTAARLQGDLDLNPAGVAVALSYQERIQELEARIRELECLLPERLPER